MSWKKNAISYLIWFLYTIMTGTVLLALATEAGKAAGLEDYTGILIMAASVAVAGVAAFLLHRFAVSRASFAEEKNEKDAVSAKCHFPWSRQTAWAAIPFLVPVKPIPSSVVAFTLTWDMSIDSAPAILSRIRGR